MISSYKNQDIPSLMIVSSPPSICEKRYSTNVPNALIQEKILVDAFFFEKFNKLKKDYKSEKRIIRNMESSGTLWIEE